MNFNFCKPYSSPRELINIQSLFETHSFCGNEGFFSSQCARKLRNDFPGSEVFLTPSCTAALELSALLYNVNHETVVVIPSFTFVSTANAFVLFGAKIIFCDVNPCTGNLCIDDLQDILCRYPVDIVVSVNYAGSSCDYIALTGLCHAHGAVLIEDNAQGICSYYADQRLGSFGSASAISFHQTKNIHCGEGGALVVNDPSLFERAYVLQEKGTNRRAFLEGLVDKYTWKDVGSSYLLSELNCAFLAAQLESINSISQLRADAWSFFDSNIDYASFSTLKLVYETRSRHNHHIFGLLTKSHDHQRELISLFRSAGIGAVFHYQPLHTTDIGINHTYVYRELPGTDYIASRIIRLPLWPGIDYQALTKSINSLSL